MTARTTGLSNARQAEAMGEDPPGSEQRDSITSPHRRKELANFLRTRREKMKPESVGLSQGPRRRTPGLRREEVAEIAGVGTTWYTWLEQARDIQPSTEVLRRLAQALKLNDAEIRHLFNLAGKAPPVESEARVEGLTPPLKRLIDEAIHVPAIILGSRWDILAVNQQAEQEFPGLMDLPNDRKNWVYFIFCQPRARQMLKHWEVKARRVLAEFRSSLSKSIDNPWVIEIVELLKRESQEFATWWREHDVSGYDTMTVEMTEGGDAADATNTWERLVLLPSEHPGYRVLVFTPLKNSSSGK